MEQLALAPVLRVWDNSGNLAVGGSIFTYAAGTSTPQATYTDATGSTPQTNPVILNGRGEASIWVVPNQSYKFVAYDATGNLLWTTDNMITGISQLNLPGVVGTSKNARISNASANTFLNYTADELIVETALGGTQYKLNTITASLTNMDSGVIPASTWVYGYLFYNPTTGQTQLIGSTTSTTSVYTGSSAPLGYTASALVTAWLTNGGNQFVIGIQLGNQFGIQNMTILSTATQQSSYTTLNISGAVPAIAKTVSGEMVMSGTTGGNYRLQVSGNNVSAGVALGEQVFFSTALGSTEVETSFVNLPLVSPQTLSYICTQSAAMTNFTIIINGYTI